jgi:TolA-binding protein
VDRLTRRELKQDEFRESFGRLEDYAKQHYKEILNLVIVVIAVVGLALGLKYYVDRQNGEASLALSAALKTFRGYVGTPPQGAVDPGMATFPTAQEKYKKALEQFTAIVQKYRIYPRPKAVSIALYHVGVCQALLGDQAAAIKTLQEASRDREREIAALAQFALAGELVKAGKLPDAAKMYQALADRPTLSVPRATALLALADAYRATQPAQARQIYERVEKEFGSDPALALAIKQQMAGVAP